MREIPVPGPVARMDYDRSSFISVIDSTMASAILAEEVESLVRKDVTWNFTETAIFQR